MSIIKFRKVPELLPNRKVRIVRREQLCFQCTRQPISLNESTYSNPANFQSKSSLFVAKLVVMFTLTYAMLAVARDVVLEASPSARGGLEAVF